jgi:organic radical activating enzyme
MYNGEKIINAGIKNYNLKTFTWNLIDVCNQRCAYCYEGFGSDEFRPVSTFFKNQSQINSYKNVLKILKLKSIGQFEVDIIGGEPTLHPHLYEILEQLNSLENCVEISLLTNLKKPLSYYEKLNKPEYNKVLFCPSIHFDYYKEDLLTKCIEISKFQNTQIIPIVMLHDNKKHWVNMENFINGLIQHNIEYTISFVYSCFEYVANYTDDFHTRFNKFIVNDNNRYNFNDNLILDKNDIYQNNLIEFKGWKCKPLRYIIKHTGEISNACTKKPLSFINTNNFEICPREQCGCDVQWNYEKYKN